MQTPTKLNKIESMLRLALAEIETMKLQEKKKPIKRSYATDIARRESRLVKKQ